MFPGNKHLVLAVVFGTCCSFGPLGARADTAHELSGALDFAGFDLIGQRNPLSGGVDFLATNEFDGAAFDFGAWDLSLRGPISLQVSTGGRLLSQFDVSFTTAANGSAQPTPLGYVLNYDVGPQSMQISGSVLTDVDFSINRFGFYDLSVTYSSRQDTTTSGRFSNDTASHDLDLGPIRVSGNLYADALAILTDPIFDRSGTPNVFASLSGNQVLNDLLSGSAVNAQEMLASGVNPAEASAPRALWLGWGNGGTPPGQGNGRGNGNGGGNGNTSGGAVPEPAVLLLMLLGVPAILIRPGHRRPMGRLRRRPPPEDRSAPSA